MSQKSSLSSFSYLHFSNPYISYFIWGVRKWPRKYNCCTIFTSSSAADDFLQINIFHKKKVLGYLTSYFENSTSHTNVVSLNWEFWLLTKYSILLLYSLVNKMLTEKMAKIIHTFLYTLRWNQVVHDTHSSNALTLKHVKTFPVPLKGYAIIQNKNLKFYGLLLLQHQTKIN